METEIQVQAGPSRFSSLIILFSFALLSCSAFAVPNPPVITGAQNQELDNASRINRALGNYTIPFALNYPVDPTITSEATVTPATIASNMVDGRRLTLQTGSYGDLTISGSDMEFIFEPGVRLGVVTFSGQARRIRVGCSTPRNCSMTGVTYPEAAWDGYPEDILVDGISAEGARSNFMHGHRLALINSRIQTVYYAIGTFNAISGLPYTDYIIANSEFESLRSGGGNWIGRHHNISRFAYVGNHGITNQYYSHIWRFHGGNNSDTQDLYIAGNLMHGPAGPMTINSTGTANPPADRISNVWVEDNDIYITRPYDSAFIQTAHPEFLENFSVTNNRFFGSARYVTSYGRVQPSWTITDNTISPSGTPPPWNFQ